jgi:hypothetical protein
VVVQKDSTFQGLMDLQEDYIASRVYPYLHNKARAERLKEFDCSGNMQTEEAL